MNDALQKAVSRRRFQLLAIHRGQRRGGGLGREGRELRQALRQRSRDAGRRPPSEIKTRPGHRARHHRSGGLQLARPADHPHRHRPRAGRPLWALRPATSTPTVQAAIGGQAAGDLYEDGSDRHFPMIVRLAPRIPREPRRDPAHHRRRAQPGGNGVVQVPLADVADVGWCRAPPSSIASSRSATSRSSSACAAATSAARCSRRSSSVAEEVKLPGGYRLEWVGEFGNLQERAAAAGDRRAAQHRADPAAALYQLRLADATRCWRPASSRWR